MTQCGAPPGLWTCDWVGQGQGRARCGCVCVAARVGHVLVAANWGRGVRAGVRACMRAQERGRGGGAGRGRRSRAIPAPSTAPFGVAWPLAAAAGRPPQGLALVGAVDCDDKNNGQLCGRSARARPPGRPPVACAVFAADAPGEEGDGGGALKATGDHQHACAGLLPVGRFKRRHPPEAPGLARLPLVFGGVGCVACLPAALCVCVSCWGGGSRCRRVPPQPQTLDPAPPPLSSPPPPPPHPLLHAQV